MMFFLEFQKIEAIAKVKQIKYASVFDQIGKNLIKGIPPTIKNNCNYASKHSERDKKL